MCEKYDPSQDIQEELEFDRREIEYDERGYQYTEEDYEWGFGYDDGDILQ